MKSSYDTSAIPQIEGARVALLQSEWYSEYSDSMVHHCQEILQQINCEEIYHHRLPGALELPLAARRVARNSTPKLDAIVVFGVLLKGETDHYQMILDLVTRGFERVMFEEDIPIIIELLPVTSIEQVKARARDNDSNKGREAAIATAKIIAWNRSLCA